MSEERPGYEDSDAPPAETVTVSCRIVFEKDLADGKRKVSLAPIDNSDSWLLSLKAADGIVTKLRISTEALSVLCEIAATIAQDRA